MNPQTISIATISILLDSLRFSVTPDARQVGLLVAERLMYTPSMGVCLGAGWVLSTLSLGTAWGVGGAGGAKQAATAAAAVPPRSSWRRYAVGCSLSLPVFLLHLLSSLQSFLLPTLPMSSLHFIHLFIHLPCVVHLLWIFCPLSMMKGRNRQLHRSGCWSSTSACCALDGANEADHDDHTIIITNAICTRTP